MSVSDLENFLNHIPDFTFILYARGDGPNAADAVGPNLISAIELYYSAVGGGSFHGPFPRPDAENNSREAERRRRETGKAVVAWVEELHQRKDISFILAWNVFGDEEAHLDYSDGHSLNDVSDKLLALLQDELAGDP